MVAAAAPETHTQISIREVADPSTDSAVCCRTGLGTLHDCSHSIEIGSSKCELHLSVGAQARDAWPRQRFRESLKLLDVDKHLGFPHSLLHYMVGYTT